MGWIYIVKYKSRDHLYIWIYYRWEHSEFPNIWICNLTSRVMYDLYVSKFTEVNLMLQIFIIAIHSNSAGGCWHVRIRTGKIKLFYLYQDQDCCRAILRHKCTEIYPHIRYMWWNMIFTMVWLGLVPHPLSQGQCNRVPDWGAYQWSLVCSNLRLIELRCSIDEKCTWKQFTLNAISLSLLKKAAILPYTDLKALWYYANAANHHRFKIENNHCIRALCWSRATLLSIISDLSAGSGHHLPRPASAASILQAEGLRPQEPLWDGEVPEMWRQRYSLLVSMIVILITSAGLCTLR